MANNAKVTISVVDKATRALSRIEKSLGGMKRSVKGFAGVVGGLVGIGGLGAMIKGSIDAADEVGKLSQRLGVSTQALSEYKHVADLTGVSFRTLTTAWQRQGRRIAEAAQGTGEARNALRELGLEAESLKALSLDRQFEVLADAIMNVENPADRVRLAMKLWDSEGVALIQTIQGGSTSLQDMREQAKSLGLSLDESATKGAAEANDALTKMAASGKALGLTLARVLGPVIVKVTEWLGRTIPAAIEIVKRAFHEFQQFIFQIGSSVTGYLSREAERWAGYADFLGFDEVAQSLRNTSDAYQQSAVIMTDSAKFSQSAIDDLTNSHTQLVTELENNITYQTLYNAELAKGHQATIAAKKAKEGLAEAQKTLNVAQQQGIKVAEEEVDTMSRALDLIESEFEELEQQAAKEFAGLGKVVEDEAKTMTSAANDLGSAFGNVVSGLVDGSLTAKQALGQLLNTVIQLLLKTNGLRGGGVGSFFSTLTANLLGSFGGGRASGGSVLGGRSYLVGERGPELLTMPSSGHITPNHRMGGTINNNIAINVAGPVDRRTISQIRSAVGRETARAMSRGD